jgi:hypothetical protein
VRVGQQVPRVRNVPAYDTTLGREAVDFMIHIGQPLLPWQGDIIVDTFGRRTDGKWSSKHAVVLVSRQSGKGRVTDAQELPALFLLREPLILHSAHEFKTSQKTFQRLIGVIEGSSWLSSRVAKVSRSKGDEGIKLTRAAGGGELQFVARTEGSSRGFSAERLVFDEAYALTVGQFAAQTPTLATLPNPQITYTTTPPDAKLGPLPEDAMLPSIRRRGHKGDPTVALWEWSPGPGDAYGDVETWYACNPSLGYLISEEFLHDQYRSFSEANAVAKFATEHLGKWPEGADAQWLVIPEADWLAACDPDSRIEGRRVMALDVTPDRGMGAIGVAGRRADGLRHIELIAHHPGTGWMVERARQLNGKWRPAAWIVDPAGHAGSLIPDLEAAGITVTRMTAQEAAAAYGQIYDGLSGTVPDEPGARNPRDVRHRGQGPLTAAVAGADTRKLAGGTAWARISESVDISPVKVVTDALYGFAKFCQGQVSAPAAARSTQPPTGTRSQLWRPGQRLQI